VKAHPVNITCVQVYAPTTSVETADTEDFYRHLHAALNETMRKDVLILMGDWKAKTGKGEKPGTVGRYGLGNSNEAGEQLLEFCEENDLFLANTYLEQPEQRLYIWTSPDGQYKNQLTIYLAEDDAEVPLSQWKRPDADCLSDNLLTATLRIKLKNAQPVKKGWKLDIDNIPEEYKNEIKQKLATINLQGKNSRGNMESLEGHLQRGGRQNHPEKKKEKQTQLYVPRHIQGRGEQAKNENRRKLGQSKKTKWRY
jgi:hypothetical protein